MAGLLLAGFYWRPTTCLPRAPTARLLAAPQSFAAYFRPPTTNRLLLATTSRPTSGRLPLTAFCRPPPLGRQRLGASDWLLLNPLRAVGARTCSPEGAVAISGGPLLTVSWSRLAMTAAWAWTDDEPRESASGAARAPLGLRYRGSGTAGGAARLGRGGRLRRPMASERPASAVERLCTCAPHEYDLAGVPPEEWPNGVLGPWGSKRGGATSGAP